MGGAALLAQFVEHSPGKREDAGSNPVQGCKFSSIHEAFNLVYANSQIPYSISTSMGIVYTGLHSGVFPFVYTSVKEDIIEV